MNRNARRRRGRSRARPGLERLEGRQLLDSALATLGLDLGSGLADGSTAIVAQQEPDQPFIPGDPGQPVIPVDPGQPFIPGAPGIPFDPTDPTLLPLLPVGPTPGVPTPLDPSAIPEFLDSPRPMSRFAYVTPEGTRVAVHLIGAGTLDGTSVRPDGSLDLVYNHTNDLSQIFAHAFGGTGRAPLASIRDADVNLESRGGARGNVLGLMALRPFDLVPGGTINLTGGLRRLVLGSAGADSRIFLRDLPEELQPTILRDGVRTQFGVSELEGIELQLVRGHFVPAFTIPAADPFQEIPFGSRPAPPGVRIIIDRVDGAPGAMTVPGPQQVFGYDPTAGALIRFDATTGQQLQVIGVPSLGPAQAGVGLGRFHDQLVVLVGQGATVRVFDAETGAPVGQFTTENLTGFDAIDGIAKTDVRTVLVDADPEGPGRAQIIDVTASLLSGEAVPLGSAFVPGRGLVLTGAAAGLPGSDLLFATAGAVFDPFQPEVRLPGLLTANTTLDRLREIDRDPFGLNLPAVEVPTPEALGSVDLLLARVTGVEDGANQVSLIRPDTLSTVRTIELQYPNRLAGLSESFREPLTGSATIDVQGDIQAFLSRDVRGMTLNNTGILNLLMVGRGRDSFIAGFPVGHVAFWNERSNVEIVSSARPFVDDRGGVTVLPNLIPLGPLITT